MVKRVCWATALLPALIFGTFGITRPARAADHLLFCNQPERIVMSGAHADARLVGGRTYRIFFHYRNGTRATGPLVIGFQGTSGKPLGITVRKGIGDPRRDPTIAGQQAMARYLTAPDTAYVGKGYARFPVTLRPGEVASGVLSVRADQDVRMRIYFKHGKWTVPGARVVAVDAPRREIAVMLSPAASRQYFRIGLPGTLGGALGAIFPGAYGLLYDFRVQAPKGRTVRVLFSARGGKSGLVGTLAGVLRQTPLVESPGWGVFGEAIATAAPLVLKTLPFGGAFYPVELAFQLL